MVAGGGTRSWAFSSQVFTPETWKVGRQEDGLSPGQKVSNQSYKITLPCRFQIRKFERGKGKIFFNLRREKNEGGELMLSLFLNRRMLRRQRFLMVLIFRLGQKAKHDLKTEKVE